MAGFTLPGDLYYGKGSPEALKIFKGKKAVACAGGSIKHTGLLNLVNSRNKTLQ